MEESEALEQVRSNYRGMLDGGLLSLATERSSLTDAAQRMLDAEISRRGLGEAAVEAWKHESHPAAKPPHKHHWKTRLKRFYMRLPFSPYYLMGLIYYLEVRWMAHQRGASIAPVIVFFASIIAGWVFVILVPARRNR